MRKKIINFIEFFHLPLIQFIPAETFRYLFCGVSTVIIDWLVCWFCYYYIFHQQPVNLPIHNISATNFSKAISMFCGFIWGFGLNKYIVFTSSKVRGRQQLFRYFIIVASCVVLNFIIINFFKNKIGLSITQSNFLTSILVAVYSYIVQRRFTFKVTKKHQLQMIDAEDEDSEIE